MKKVFFSGFIFLSLIGSGWSQKGAVVDVQYILEKMPAYKAAQDEINQISQKWQKELEDKYKEIERKYDEFEAELVLLPDDVKKLKQEEIYELEREAKEYKQSKFGFDGELYKIQDEKIRPVQDQVYAAIENMARERKLELILDKGNDAVLYYEKLFDKTSEVLNKLGIQDK